MKTNIIYNNTPDNNIDIIIIIICYYLFKIYKPICNKYLCDESSDLLEYELF